MNPFKIHHVILALALLGSSCTQTSNTSSQAAAPSDSSKTVLNYIITCDSVGIISRNDKEQQLRIKFGETTISRDSFFLEGMFQEMISVVNKGEVDELKIHWNKHGQIRMVEIDNPRSPYQLANGVKIGTSLAELTQINQKAISFYGFGWDYGGTINNFNKGVLENQFPCFSGVLMQDKENAKTEINLFGDKVFTTDTPDIDQHNICLKVIRVSYR